MAKQLSHERYSHQLRRTEWWPRGNGSAWLTRLLAFIACAAGGLYADVALAGEELISVVGVGEVLSTPNRVKIDFRVSASETNSSDAIKKYRASRDDVRKAVESLGLKHLSIEKQGFAIGHGPRTVSLADFPKIVSQRVDGSSDGEVNITVAENLRVVLQDVQEIEEAELINTIGNILDAAKAAGASVGSQRSEDMFGQMARMLADQRRKDPVVKFVVTDVKKLRERAYQEAFLQARERAERLAKLAEVTLGSVHSVDDQSEVPSDCNGEENALAKSNHVSAEFSAIPVRVQLRVRFKIAR